MDSSLTTRHMTSCGIGIFFVELYLKLHVLNDFKKKKIQKQNKSSYPNKNLHSLMAYVWDYQQ